MRTAGDPGRKMKNETNFPLLRTVLRDTAPVIAGYLILGMGFGILMDANGFGVLHSAAMSIFVYAGSMQYAAVGLLTGGAPIVTVALTTLAVNARHLFYGISMTEKYRNAGAAKPYLIFGLTDETYALVCRTERGKNYCLLVTLFDHAYWVTGTLLGALLGGVLDFNSEGIDFSLTALFVTVFLSQWLDGDRRAHLSALTGLGCTAVSLAVFGRGSFLIPAMCTISVLLLLTGVGSAKKEKSGKEGRA